MLLKWISCRSVSNTEPLEREIRALRNEYQMQSELHEKMKEEVNKVKKTVSDYARTIHSVKGQINSLDIALKNAESSLFSITDVAIWVCFIRVINMLL